MVAMCEIRTRGINEAMTRATGTSTTIHRGMYELDELVEFFVRLKDIASAVPSANRTALAMTDTAGQHYEFFARQGDLRLCETNQRVSPHTAAMLAGGVIALEQTHNVSALSA